MAFHPGTESGNRHRVSQNDRIIGHREKQFDRLIRQLDSFALFILLLWIFDKLTPGLM